MFEIINLFPIPLYSGYLPNKYSSLEPFLESQELIILENHNNQGIKSKNFNILDLNELKPLSNYILEQVKIYASTHLNLSHSYYKFTQSWVSIKNTNESHAPHMHSNSLISGIFYFGQADNLTPKVGFQKLFSSDSYLLQPQFQNNYNPLEGPVYFDSTPGKMYIFPSFLGHFVPVNNSSLPRKCVAFNILPTDGLGDENNGNRINFLI
jgi:uncharacterized protein (TIGR02466 family)